MKISKKANNIVKFLVLFSALVPGEFASAGIINGNFTDRFTGWRREAIDVGTNTLTTITQPDFIYQPNFQLLTPSGTLLQTSSTEASPNDFWSVGISQQFTIDSPLNTGEQLQLSVDLSSYLSDLVVDFSFGQIEDLSSTDPLDPLDLSSGGIFDLTSWTGRTVLISFGVQDNDDLNDSVVIRSVKLEVVPASNIPLPNSAILMLSALALLRRNFFYKGA